MLECPDGTFGIGCTGVCHCASDNECTKSNGACSGSCEGGYKKVNGNCQTGNFNVVIYSSLSELYFDLTKVIILHAPQDLITSHHLSNYIDMDIQCICNIFNQIRINCDRE